MAKLAVRPSPEEMQALLTSAADCLNCDAPECHEFTPEGVDVCAELPYWNGKPVTREMLVEWQALLKTESNGRVA